MRFPDGFLWGAATSAFQYEGAANEGGKGLTTADTRAAGLHGESSAIATAADGYHRWHEDVELMAELGLTSYRLSICWARILPNGDDDVPNAEGIAYYREVLEALRERGIEPVVTLFHFDIPYDLVRRYEGFVDRRCIDAFVGYCELCFREFGDLVGHWITINEQSVVAHIPAMLGLSTDDPDLALKLAKADYHMYLASAKVTSTCHRILPGVPIGPDVSYPTILPMTPKTENILVAYDAEEKLAYEPMDIYSRGIVAPRLAREWADLGLSIPEEPGDLETLADGVCDYLGVNWYSTMAVENRGEGGFNIGLGDTKRVSWLTYTEWGWSYDPLGLRMALMECWARYRKPIMVCENGWSERERLEDGAVHDPMRSSYLRDHLVSIRDAIELGVDVIGYQHWSLVDIMSSSDGFEKRYGLVFVDEKTLERTKKDSFETYREIIATQGESLEA